MGCVIGPSLYQMTPSSPRGPQDLGQRWSSINSWKQVPFSPREARISGNSQLFRFQEQPSSATDHLIIVSDTGMVDDRILQLSHRPFLIQCVNRSSPRLGYDVMFFKFNSDRSKEYPALHFVEAYAVSLKLSARFKVKAAEVEGGQLQWWEKNVPDNMADIHSTQEFLNALSQAGERLVVVDFYGTWCGSCRALFPKLCKIALEHPEILFLKVNFDENKSLCKSLNIKVLPYFHFYRGEDGLLESFSCSLAKFQKLKDAIATHNRGSSTIIPPLENASESSS